MALPTNCDLEAKAEIARLQPIFKEVFNDGPYTSFHMIDYLLKRQAKMEYIDLVGNWQAVRGRISEESIRQESLNGQLRPTWADNPGRCTAFALKIIHLADIRYPGRYEWEMFRVGRNHHLARCRNTGAVIDSSAKTGVDILPENEWKNIYKTRMWYQDHYSQTQRPHDKESKPAVGPVRPKDALIFCLMGVREMADEPKLICYFRFFKPKAREARYYGMIEWTITKKEVVLIPSLTYPDNRYRIRFGDGNSATETRKSASFVAEFVRTYTGPQGFQQWETSQLAEIQRQLFEAALLTWGFPKLQRPIWPESFHQSTGKRSNGRSPQR